MMKTILKIRVFAIVFFVGNALHAQNYRELSLAITDSAGTIVNYDGASAFPSNTLSDSFGYDPNAPETSTPVQTYSTQDALGFTTLSDAWVEYSLSSPIALGNGFTFSFDLWGSESNTTSDDLFNIELYDLSGTLFHTIVAGITNDETFYNRYSITDANIDPTTVLASFIIRNQQETKILALQK